MKGGVGAADSAISVYGGIGEQRAVGANDNTIAMKQLSGGRRKKRHGGSMGTELAASMGLLALNEIAKRRNKSEKKGGKSRKSGGKKRRTNRRK